MINAFNRFNNGVWFIFTIDLLLSIIIYHWWFILIKYCIDSLLYDPSYYLGVNNTDNLLLNSICQSI